MATNRFTTGLAWARKQLRAHASDYATYARGAASCSVVGTISQQRSISATAQNTQVVADAFDFILHDKSELVLSNSATLPKSNDTITVGGVTYRVTAQQDGETWRPSGSGNSIRIHVVLN